MLRGRLRTAGDAVELDESEAEAYLDAGTLGTAPPEAPEAAPVPNPTAGLSQQEQDLLAAFRRFDGRLGLLEKKVTQIQEQVEDLDEQVPQIKARSVEAASGDRADAARITALESSVEDLLMQVEGLQEQYAPVVLSTVEETDESTPGDEEPGLLDIDGIGPVRLRKLADAGVETLLDLQQAGAATLAAKTELSQSDIEDWQRQAGALAAGGSR